MPRIAASIDGNLGGRDWLPWRETHLNVRQNGKTSSDTGEVGLASLGVGGPTFHLHGENAKTSSGSEEVSAQI